uniref:WD domaincontaining protein putative n=1 Tax=Albugo laibachii Nc14 TaxID=890382 RepID=F0WLB8_9STRA|nr:WD domaincontaining protein putative [Albugo laibachii Nc14]|eukprot:CCA22081.1 WD domaincontaining protein putative [Albugo laibachii Nc14]
MVITSDEVNFLVYRYLQESGFLHSAFTFAYESQLVKSSVITSDIPPGALISFVQKGLQYVGIEAHLNEDGTERDCDTAYSLLDPHICRVAQSATADTSASDADLHTARGANSKVSNKRKRKTATENTDEAVLEGDKGEEEQNKGEESDEKSIVFLSGHEKEVFGCMWNPVRNLLVSGSSDSTARIWEVSPNILPDMQSQIAPKVLHHGDGPHKDVTTLEWSSDGNYLATGTYNGKTTIWNAEGEKKHELHDHNGPVFAVRWSKTSKYLLSSSFDKSVSIWDVTKESKAQQIHLHDDPILDASWKDDLTYATCSSDQTISIARVGDAKAQFVLRGHNDAINSIRWDPTYQLLASCSDDYTVKIWDPTRCSENNLRNEQKNNSEQESNSHTINDTENLNCHEKPTNQSTNDRKTVHDVNPIVHSLQEHTKEVYTIRWSFTGPGTDLPNAPLTLASASFDATIKIWDVEAGRCTQTYSHSNPVYGVAYNPNGDYLASGTIGGSLNIWSLRDGRLVKTYKVNGDIYDLNWNAQGTLLSACISNGDLALLHLRV